MPDLDLRISGWRPWGLGFKIYNMYKDIHISVYIYIYMYTHIHLNEHSMASVARCYLALMMQSLPYLGI